ncbi:MAG: aldo/keto reductase [Acidothermus sp.]|nr:aldo/keto reductase [Acidothermus sp.]MCL6537732.1 aldo/keto reductase [Acidothermus sp.]
MQFRVIGRGEETVRVSAIGLGEMPLSLAGRPDEKQAIATIHAALDAGITLIDTADAYCAGPHEVGHGERLVAKALATYPGDTSSVLVATKGGHLRTPDGGWYVDGRPEYLRQAAEASLKALGVDVIGLYQFHRPDPKVPYADSVGVLKELLDEGKIRFAGISNANIEQIKIADEILGGRLASVQNQFAPNFRSSEGELVFTGQRGIAFLPWSPLGGIGRAEETVRRYPAFAEVARERGVSPQQVVLAWMLAKGDHVIPIPGCSRPETARSSAAAADIVLTPDEVARLDAS